MAWSSARALLRPMFKLENFASRHGPEFYGLPLNRDTVTLVKKEWRVPRQAGFGRDKLVPFRAGGSIAWKLA